MAETSFHTTYSNNRYLFARAVNGSQSGLQRRGYHRFGFDGGSSSTLIQDGNNELVSPSWYKDNTISVGVTFSSGE
ncbi:MAG: hypothetical protein A2W93_09615 [Bacteroidetes bacterium GWF2_43_63]|nr:MAG: hypothetical protein A2W94_07100 [Bacteroidetes bacterium GWE2_42_42]OFY54564.1 MAG: hypothetical protein A2W93_09615 [Bacteroidetes bacterium GWF2_43_63]HBG70627.1 hypothetical protein [Bacteroidales bacterium]HCB60923.1 hypothetical protein [Bacteroidales bacterium]